MDETTGETRGFLSASVLSDQLRELALQKGPGAKLPTVSELCDLYNTSRATLHDALRHLEQSHVIYRQHSKGIFVSPKLYRKTICILFDSSLLGGLSSSPFWGSLCSLIAQEMQKRMEAKNEYYTFHFVVRSSQGQVLIPEEVREQMQQKRIHTFLTIGLSVPEWLGPDKQEWGVAPCISYAGYSRWMVYEDYHGLIKLGVPALVKQGCRRIGLWVPQWGLEGNALWDYQDVFFQRLAEHQLEADPRLVRGVPADEHFMRDGRKLSYQEQGYYTVLDIFGDTADPALPRPDGVLIMDDMMTFGALAALRRLNPVPYQEVKIATHANVGSLLFLDAPKDLTIIEFDPADIVQEMFSLLDRLLAGEEPATEPVKIVPRYHSSSHF